MQKSAAHVGGELIEDESVDSDLEDEMEMETRNTILSTSKAPPFWEERMPKADDASIYFLRSID